jgi:tellurite resistance protein TehA-like permease
MVNVSLVALGLRSGYVSLEPERLRHTNPGAIACVAILVMMPLFALLSVDHSVRRWKSDKLARPSWDRNPLNWWGDPLQSLFVSTCIMAATAIGSALRRPTVGSVAFWTFGVFVCFAIGLLVGQVLVYRVYREQIALSKP